MKKKSASQSAPARPSLGEGGFLNLRVLFGLFVIIAGVFLALLSFGPATTGFAQGTSREEMALTLAQALGVFQPPACVPGQEMFNDVPASSPFCPFIEELARRGITGGCGGGNYCPGDPVTRQQMAVFLVKATEAALSGPLASGDTLRGMWAMGGFRAIGEFPAETAISFQVPLAAAPQTQFVPDGGPPTAQCPGSFGTPLAAPGFLCF
jgi:hypothetical protein